MNLVNDRSSILSVLNEPFDIKNFVKKYHIVDVRNENYEIEFDLIEISSAIVNTFRRIILSEVQSMAIEKVHIFNNTLIIQDEVLAHRLGLIPLKADPRIFSSVTDDSSEYNEKNSLEFELKMKCTWNKETNKKDSSRAEDMYRNDIATAFYRNLPDIKKVREVEGEAAYRLQDCFSPGVISVRQESNEKKIAVVNNVRYDTGSRNVHRHGDIKNAVMMSRIQDHFIFTIESVGALQPEDIFKKAVTFLRNKSRDLFDELNSSSLFN